MSKLIPQRTVDAIRRMTDVILDYAGIDCTLCIPTVGSYNEAEKLDIYSTPEDYIPYTAYLAKVFINWRPDLYQLKRLGLFTEGQLPILVRFGNKAKVLGGSSAGTEVPIDIVKRSYFRIYPEFINSEYCTNSALFMRKFSGGTSSGAFIVGETINQASSGWIGKFVAEVSNILHVENTPETPDPDNTGQLVGDTSGKTYTPTFTSNVGVTEFEIVNVAVQGIHDAVLTKIYSAVPRRVKI